MTACQFRNSHFILSRPLHLSPAVDIRRRVAGPGLNPTLSIVDDQFRPIPDGDFARGGDGARLRHVRRRWPPNAGALDRPLPQVRDHMLVVTGMLKLFLKHLNARAAQFITDFTERAPQQPSASDGSEELVAKPPPDQGLEAVRLFKSAQALSRLDRRRFSLAPGSCVAAKRAVERGCRHDADFA